MTENIQLYDKVFKPFISEAKLREAIQKVSDKLNNELKDKDPLFLIVLNGAFIFAADLLRKFEHNCDISFIKLSSYSGTKSTHTVREIIGLDYNVKDRTVVIVEDIIDTGITMEHIIAQMQQLGAKEVKVATLLFKPGSFQKTYNIDYIALDIPNDFIVGYGLDYDGKGRNLSEIYTIVE